MTDGPNEMPPKMQTVHKDAIDNLIFLKRQQWTITNYVIVAFAGIYAICGSCDLSGKIGLTVFAAAAATYGLWILTHLQGGMNKFRDRLGWLYQNYFTCTEREELVLPTKSARPYEHAFVWPLRFAIIAGALIVLYRIWHP